MKYLLEIYGYGGEYCLGRVRDNAIFDFLKSKNDSGEEINAYYDEDTDGIELRFYEYNDIVSVCNAAREVKLELTDENNDSVEINDQEISYYVLSNPYIEKETDDSVLGYYGGANIEKGFFCNAELITEEKFDEKNLILLTCNLDETICQDEVITHVLYIKPTRLCEIINEFYKDQEAIEELDEFDEDYDIYVSDFFYDVNRENKLYELFRDYIIDLDYDTSSTMTKDSFGVFYDKKNI